MKFSSKLVPIITIKQFDEIATDFLNKLYPEALYIPMEIPIEEIAYKKMNLIIEHVNISDDLSIYGQIFFNNGITEIYKPDTDEFIKVMVEKGTVFIDGNVLYKRNIGCVRNTIAHECLHWFKHQPYFSLKSVRGNKNLMATRCSINTKSEKKKEDWLEEDWLEWQANGIAPRILMPKDMFELKARKNKYLRKLNSENCDDYQRLIRLAVKELANFFNVSKQSTAIRLKELGII